MGPLLIPGDVAHLVGYVWAMFNYRPTQPCTFQEHLLDQELEDALQKATQALELLGIDGR